MLKKAIFREFAGYVSLNVLGMVCLSCYVLVDTFFIARALGSNGLAALNFSISVFSIMHGLGLMIGIGGATQFTILKSKDENANTIFTHSLFAGLSVAIILVTVGMFFSTPLAKILGADAVTLPLTRAYMQTILYFSPLSLANNILIAFIRNDNNPKLAMAGMVIGSFANIVFDYLFLFPLAMGMFGAALASGLSFFLGICVLSLHFFTKNNTLGLCKCKIQIKKIMNIVFLGSAAFIGELSFAITLITFNLVILRIEGNIGVAAYGIVVNMAIIPISVLTGVAQGIQPLTSKGHGSGDNFLIRHTLRYAITSVFLTSLFIYAVIYIYSQNIVSAFNNEANTVLALLATTGLKIYFIGFIFASVNIVAAAFFCAIADAKIGLIISVLRGCVIIVPMVIIFSAILQMSGVWLSFILTELTVSVLTIIYLCKKNKKS